jgi:anoctamin-10
MVTQFGYVTIWSIVWPLAPIFALINNYVELRADAVKICKHVRRPVGDRVETIGSWLETLVRFSFTLTVRSTTDNAEYHILDRSGSLFHPNLPLPPDPPTRDQRSNP